MKMAQKTGLKSLHIWLSRPDFCLLFIRDLYKMLFYKENGRAERPACFFAEILLAGKVYIPQRLRCLQYQPLPNLLPISGGICFRLSPAAFHINEGAYCC